MSTVAQPSAFETARRAPWLGLLVFATVLMYKPLGHAILVTLHTILPGPEQYIAGALIGLGGFVLIWMGMKRDELTATIMGMLGGSALWMGWFEHSFHAFSELLNVQPLMHNGEMALSPGLLIIEASGVILLTMLVFFGANRETRCRLLKWVHRNARITPDAPTPNYRRSYAWVTALENLFITWTFYVLIILLYDPRLFGINHPVTYTAFGVFIVWGSYLLWKLSAFTEPGAAIRYAIPVANAFWITIEMGSHWGWWKELWTRPVEYPVVNIAIMLAFVGGVVWMATSSQRGLKHPSAGKLAAA
jgi:hypothetical protein